MEVIIRKAKEKEGKELARIEAVCFPPAEAASEAAILERLEAFPENFYVAEQNGKLVGAVTHVLVNDPTIGDGIFIENMLDAAG